MDTHYSNEQCIHFNRSIMSMYVSNLFQLNIYKYCFVEIIAFIEPLIKLTIISGILKVNYVIVVPSKRICS